MTKTLYLGLQNILKKTMSHRHFLINSKIELFIIIRNTHLSLIFRRSPKNTVEKHYLKRHPSSLFKKQIKIIFLNLVDKV